MKNSFLLLAMAALLFSCSSEDDNPTNPDDGGGNNTEIYFMNTVNSYWIYENESEDENGNMVTTYDSVYVKSVEDNKDGKEAYNCETRTDMDGNGTYEENNGNVHYAASTTAFFSHKDSFTPGNISLDMFGDLEEQIEIKSDWVKISDTEDNDWEILESEIDIEVQGGIGVKGDIEAEADNMNETKTFTVDGETFEAHGFELKVEFKGNISLSFGPIPINAPMSFTSITKYWVAAGIGPVQIENMPVEFDIQIPGGGGSPIEDQPGSISTLVRFEKK